MAATDNDALLKAMDQLMKEEDRASVIEYAKQLSTKGGDVVGTMRKMSQQGVDTKKEAALWKKRALLTAAVAVVVCAVMFGLMVASAEVTKEFHVVTPNKAGSGRRLTSPGALGGGSYGAAGNNDLYSTSTAAARLSEETVLGWVSGGRRLENAPARDMGVMQDGLKAMVITRTARRLDGGDDGRELAEQSVSVEPVLTTTWTYNTGRALGDDGRELTPGGTLEVKTARTCYYLPHLTEDPNCGGPDSATRVLVDSTGEREYKWDCHCASSDGTNADACINMDNRVSCV